MKTNPKDSTEKGKDEKFKVERDTLQIKEGWIRVEGGRERRKGENRRLKKGLKNVNRKHL